MFTRLFSILLFICPVFCIDFPGRLSFEESAQLKETCGRSPVKLGFPKIESPQQKSYGSRLTNRTMAPWVTSTGVFISKRHILTCAHCIKYLKLASQADRTAVISMNCTASSKFMKCNEQPIQTITIREVMYPDIYYTGGSMQIEGDLAVLTLDKEVEFNELIYPVCLSGYAINETEPIVNFGYGYSKQDELARGIDQANFLQTFTAKKNDTEKKRYFRRD